MSRMIQNARVVSKEDNALIVSICTDSSVNKTHTNVYVYLDDKLSNSYYNVDDLLEIQCDIAAPFDNMPAIQAHFITKLFDKPFKPLDEQLELESDGPVIDGFSAKQIALLQKIFRHEVAKERSRHE